MLELCRRIASRFASLRVPRCGILRESEEGPAMGQFDLIINELNIKLGAECRGLYHDVTNQPYWNVYISKSFAWEKLKDLIL